MPAELTGSATPEETTPPASRLSELASALWVVSAAFGCYFCMYAFRKPFTAASYPDTMLWGTGFKTVLVTAQVAGYMVSKFIGIKVISEMPPQRRAITLLGLILAAEAALILFGLLPRPWNAACLFLNGLPLGMVFGLVLSFLEGRRLTEALTAGLCVSFILSDGITKSVGSWLLSRGVPEDWMPAVAGGLFLSPLLVCVWMLARISAPSKFDIAARSERCVMSREDRRRLLSRYGLGLLPLIVVYLLVTVVRSVRADFAPEIWTGLGSPAVPATFTRTEMWVALGVLIVNGASVLIRDNRRAFFASLGVCGLGIALLSVSLAARAAGRLGADHFMILIGLGLYLPYVAFHTTIFERLLAMTRDRGNLGFLMYLADAIGYLGYVAVMLSRNLSAVSDGVLSLLITAGWLTVSLSTLCLIASACYFLKVRTGTAAIPAEQAA